MVTTGIMLQRALAAADLLAAQGISAGILHMHTVKPLDIEALLQAIRGVETAGDRLRSMCRPAASAAPSPKA